MTRRVSAIVNPVSGRRNMLPVVRAIGHILEREGWTLDVLLTDRAGHAIELAREVPDDTHAVLAVGGDGTVCEVINGLYPRNIPLVILRTGTENLLAR